MSIANLPHRPARSVRLREHMPQHTHVGKAPARTSASGSLAMPFLGATRVTCVRHPSVRCVPHAR